MRFFNQRDLSCDDMVLVFPEDTSPEADGSEPAATSVSLKELRQQQRVLLFHGVHRSAFALYVDEPFPEAMEGFVRQEQSARTLRIDPPIYLGPDEADFSDPYELQQECEAFEVPAGNYTVEASHVRLPAGLERKNLVSQAGWIGWGLMMLWSVWVYSLAIGVLAMTMALMRFPLMVGIVVTSIVMAGLAVTFLGRRTRAFRAAWEAQKAFDQKYPELVVVLKSTKGK